MKLTFALIFILLLTNLSPIIFSQTKRSMDIGVIAGTNYSSVFADIPPQPTGFEQEANPEDFYKYRFGYFGGVTFNYNFNNYFGVSGDLIYNLKGYNFDNENDQKIYVKLHYLELPLLINYYFLQNKNLVSNLFLGPYISYLIEGRYEAETRFGSYDGKIEEFNDFDFGITAGFSFLLPLETNKIGIDLRYDWGLSNIFNSDFFGFEEYDLSFKNSSFMLGVKFLFNIKTKSSSESEEEDDTIWR